MQRLVTAALLAAALSPAPARADRMACELWRDCDTGSGAACGGPPLRLAFTIDRNLFTLPLYRNEPPRRLVTRVAAGDETYRAEPILMADGTRGFHAQMEGSDRLLTIAPDGRAIYTDTAAAARRTGTCREIDE